MTSVTSALGDCSGGSDWEQPCSQMILNAPNPFLVGLDQQRSGGAIIGSINTRVPSSAKIVGKPNRSSYQHVMDTNGFMDSHHNFARSCSSFHLSRNLKKFEEIEVPSLFSSKESEKFNISTWWQPRWQQVMLQLSNTRVSSTGWGPWRHQHVVFDLTTSMDFTHDALHQ